MQHVVQGGHGARQHDGLNLAAADGSQKIHAFGQGGHTGHKTQGVLANLVRGWTQNIPKAEPLGRQRNVAGILPITAQVAFRHTQVPVVV